MRLPADLDDVDGLIIPGGESTTMRRLIDRWGLRQPILDLAESGAPLFGTCAGMIVLAKEIAGDEEPILPLLDVTVERNAFGRQLDSFETELVVPLLGDHPVHAVFIRAPVIERVGPERRRGREPRRRPDRRRPRAEHHRDGVPPGARRRDALPPPRGDARRRARGPGRGRRPAPPPDAPRASGCASAWHGAPGKVRAARLTDLAALGELSRLAQADSEGTRSLGLPVTGPRIGMFSLFRLPLGAFSPQRRDVRLRPRRPRRRPAPRGARQPARRVDGGRARRGRRHGRGRRALPARPAPPARRRQARRGPVPRGLRRRGRQRRAVHAGGLHPVRRRARAVPRARGPAPGAAPRGGGTGRADPAGRLARRGAPVAPLRLGHPGAGPAPRGGAASPTGSARAATGACRAARSRRSCGSPTWTRSCRSPRTAARTAPSSTGSCRSASPRRTSRTTSR